VNDVLYPESAYKRLSPRERIEASWDEDGPIPDEVMESLLAIKPIDGVTTLEARVFELALDDIEQADEHVLAVRVRGILDRYQQADERSEREGISELRWRDCGLTVYDRATCDSVARILTAAGYPTAYRAGVFRSVANRLWELRPAYRRPSALAAS
jgi:hypothetical protein